MPREAIAASDHRHERHHGHRHEAEAVHGYQEDGTYNGKAVASVILGALGFILPLVPSILAVVLGRAARIELEEEGTQRGEGLALTGLILGWAALALLAIASIMLLLTG